MSCQSITVWLASVAACELKMTLAMMINEDVLQLLVSNSPSRKPSLLRRYTVQRHHHSIHHFK